MVGHVPRRSERSQKQSSEQPVSKGRSRSGSTSRSASQRRCIKSIPNIEKSSPRKRKRSPFQAEEPKFFSRTINGRTVDRFCWLCHKECDSELVCSYCPRSYHEDCFTKIKSNCECRLKAVGGENFDGAIGHDNLKKCLEFIVQKSVKEDKKNSQKSQAVNSVFCKNFQTWPPDKNKLLKIMDLDILIDNMNSEEPYKSTGEFFNDVKWIYHNCYILYGPNHPITEAAFKMEKNFKREIIDMEACPECYFMKYSYVMDFFSRVCVRPHMIVWAKLRGSPFWPAKCLRISNGHADVRFFGTHDKSVIPVNKCYKISKENPLKDVHQAKYIDAVNELLNYIKIYENSHGPFHYYPRKTSLEDCVKKLNKKGHHNLNMEPANQNSDPKELKFRAIVENFGNENVTDPKGVDNVVCQMDFIAVEHNEPYCELNNSEDIARFSTSLPVSSHNTNLTSFEQAPSILSTGISAASNEMETQNSLNILVNNLPVITSVSTDEMALNELPVNTSAASNDIASNEVSTNCSTSVPMPLITSTVSASEIYGQENVTIPVNDTEASQSVSPLSLCNNLMRNEAFRAIFENDNEGDDEVQILSENGNISIVDQLVKSVEITKAISNILIGNRPQLKKLSLDLQNVILQFIVIMMVESSFAKFDKNDVKQFFAFLKRTMGKTQKLKETVKSLSSENGTLKIGKQEAETQVIELLNKNAKLEEEVKELKNSRIPSPEEIQNHKAELRECIMRKVEEKMQSNNRNSDSDFLEQQLNEAKEKLNIKETNINLLNRKNLALASDLECALERIRKLVEEVEKLKSDISYASMNKCHFGVQTLPIEVDTHPVQEPDKSLNFTDSSKLNPENQKDTGLTQLSVTQTSFIYETMESNSDFGGSVVQQVFEQNVSECTSITTSSPGMMSSTPAPTLVQVPMVVPANAFISAPGPYILSSMNPPEPPPPLLKSKVKSSSVMKYGVKRRKKNI